MTVGNFSETIGTNGFDSIRGEDLSVIYALDDRDNLNSNPIPLEEDPITILVGGAGNNNYIVWQNSTSFILENSDLPNILYTTIGTGSGISLDDNDSFVAEINDRHLYLGNRQTGQYIVVVDWQLPENQIETFALTEGELSYSEFVDRFRTSANYHGNFTWAELAATEEIDLDRLGLSAEEIDDDFETISARSLELSFIGSSPLSALFDRNLSEENDDLTGNFLVGDVGDWVLRGGSGNDTIFGGAGNNIIYGNSGDDILGTAIAEEPDTLTGIGGRDTLLGGFGNDVYTVSLFAGAGSIIRDRIDPDDTDILFIVAEDTQVDRLLNVDARRDPDVGSLFNPDPYLKLIANPQTFGAAEIEISLPEAGIIGMQKSGTNLIIDLDRDGIAETKDDLTISDFFDESGGLGKGSMSQINNIIDAQAIADFF